MDKFTFIMENWYIFVAGFAAAGCIGVVIGKFINLPSSEQRKKVREWLLLAVTEAEAELGGGTGKLKLRYVYDLFIQRFPAIARVISFDTFMLWVDDALEEMREMLANNKAVKELVNGTADNGGDSA